MPQCIIDFLEMVDVEHDKSTGPVPCLFLKVMLDQPPYHARIIDTGQAVTLCPGAQCLFHMDFTGNVPQDANLGGQTALIIIKRITADAEDPYTPIPPCQLKTAFYGFVLGIIQDMGYMFQSTLEYLIFRMHHDL